MSEGPRKIFNSKRGPQPKEFGNRCGRRLRRNYGERRSYVDDFYCCIGLSVNKSGFYFFMVHHYKNSLSSLHSLLFHHCTFCASLHIKTSPVSVGLLILLFNYNLLTYVCFLFGRKTALSAPKAKYRNDWKQVSIFSINQSINQIKLNQINQSIQSVSQSINQSNNHASQPASQPARESVSQSVSQSASQSVIHSFSSFADSSKHKSYRKPSSLMIQKFQS